MKSATSNWYSSRYSRIGLSWLEERAERARAPARARARRTRSAGRPVRDARISGGRSSNVRRRSGAKARTSRSVGARSRATGRRSLDQRVGVERERLQPRERQPWTRRGTSGRSRSTRRGRRPGRRSRRTAAPDEVTRSRSRSWSCADRAEHLAGVLDQQLDGAALAVEHRRPRRPRRRRSPGSVPIASLSSRPVRRRCPSRGPAASRGTRCRVPRVEGAEDLVELDGARARCPSSRRPFSGTHGSPLPGVSST